MLRIHSGSGGSQGILKYFSEGLRKADYYVLGQEIEGKWHGLALGAVGLVEGSAIEAEDFKSLVLNKHPVTGRQLTPRMNKGSSRLPGWDLTFSPPKSVSILHAITGDEAILRAFQESVREVMATIEKDVSTRVRKGGSQDDRIAGNFAWAEFIHLTTRPLSDGIPDPHLHCHAWVQNLCLDPVENRLKAIKMRNIKDQAYLYEGLHDSILAQKLSELGFPVVRTSMGWELAGLHSRELLEKFSRRTVEIEKIAAERGITEAKEKDKLGGITRGKKDKGLRHEDLVKSWKSRLTPEELATLQGVHARKNLSTASKVTVAQSLDYSQAKCFQNNSVVEKSRILSAALRFGVGSVSRADVEVEMERRGFIERQFDGSPHVTLPSLVVEEARLISIVREGRGKFAPLLPGRLKFIQEFLSKEQSQAVESLLKSNDRFQILRGRAGTGKTTLLTEFRMQLENMGIRLIALAPSADASRGVLRDEGFRGANTVARFLVDKDLQKRARGHVLLIDEAGTIGDRDVDRVLELVGPSTRVIFSGDIGQNPPVSRGKFLGLLERFAGLSPITLREIHRQKVSSYKSAVEAMADRDLRTAFARLEKIDAIEEVRADEERYRKAAIEYTQCMEETGVPPMIVSPTHAEAQTAVSAIRDRLKEIGHLGPEREFLQYRDFKWEEVEKTRSENFEPGQMVQFHQNATGIKRGGIVFVSSVDVDKTVWVESPTLKPVPLDLSKADRFRVFEVGQVPLATGDRVKITNGGKDVNGRRFDNGKLSTVKSIGKDGEITLANGLKLAADFGHLAPAYDTSFSSQGKKAREVFIFHSSKSGKAASLESFYVAVSRGEQRLRIFTDSREKLQESVGKSATRLSALELSGLGDTLFMEPGNKGKDWTQRLLESRGWRQEKMDSFVKNLAAERKLEAPQVKPRSHVQFLEMQKANSGPDGKSKSRGRPNHEKGKKQKGMAHDPRGNEKSKPDLEVGIGPVNELKAEKKFQIARQKDSESHPKSETPSKSSLVKHVGKAVDASAQHLREVLGRTMRGAEAIKNGAMRAIQFGNVKTTIGRLQNNPKTKEAQIKHETESKAAVRKPAPPQMTIRRGK